MADTLKLVTQPRQARGSQGARKLRRKGLVPAVVYGLKETNANVMLPKDDLQRAIRHGVRVLDLETDGKAQKVLIREVQWDHLGVELLHVDFARVTADQKVVVTVPLELKGVAPGVAAGGALDQPTHALSVECLAISIPESIKVVINELQIGSVIHVKEVVLPPGVKAMADPDQVVVQVRAPEVEVVAPAAGAAPAETAEPEVITARKAAEGEEETKEKEKK